MPKSLMEVCIATAAALTLELVPIVPQQPTNPPQPIPPPQTNPQPTPTTPTQPTPTTPTQPTPRVPTNPDAQAPNPAAKLKAGSVPFAFQSPQSEARFLEANQRLTLAEQRLEQSNAELLRRLGAARLLSGERQNAAVMDLLQQMLQNNAEVQRYLVQARTAWGGEFDLPAEQTEPRKRAGGDAALGR